MRNSTPNLLLAILLAAPAAAQTPARPATNSSPSPAKSLEIDAIAARVGNDVVTESQVRQLQAFQLLVDGRPQPREKVLDELVNQWIVRGEAMNTKFPRPTPVDVTIEFQTLSHQFASPAEFQSRLNSSGLTAAQVRSILESQLLYVRFLNFKFHSAASVSHAQIAAYYQDTLIPQLRQRHASIPPLSEVEPQIRQLLTQEAINEKSSKWLDDAKSKIRIVVLPPPQPPKGAG